MGSQKHRTRRAVIAAGLGLAALPARGEVPPPGTQPKISPAEAQYQPMPKGLFSCGVCTFFIKPTSCKLVAGAISPTGWCKLFDLVD
ncbi:MAG TPA: hypothetical protein VMI30_09020 [Stellaceae bacterium]|nr:hypothetical protein [Stellaceae bacterium]